MHVTRFIFLFFLLAQDARAQSYYFRRYEVENGLSNASVYCALQDRQGFMWFGTRDGINRFDGYRFKTFNIYPGDLPAGSLYTYQLAIDSGGTLWAGTGQGIFKYDSQHERFAPFIDTLSFVWDLHFDKRGRLWFIAGHSLYRYDFMAKHLTAFAPHDHFVATALAESAGCIWVAGADGRLRKTDPETDSMITYDLFAHSRKKDATTIYAVQPDDKGGLFVGTISGIKRFDPATGGYADLLLYNADKTTVFVQVILRAGPTEYWFGTRSGIYVLNTVTGRFTNLQNKGFNPYTLSNNDVRALYKDAEGGIWVGTNFGGLSYYPKQTAPYFEKYFPDDPENAIGGSIVGGICKDLQGRIWIGTEDAGLSRLDPATGEIRQFRSTGARGSLCNSNVQALLIDGNDLWVGTLDHDVDILDTRTGKVRRHILSGPRKGQLSTSTVFSMLRTKKGEIYLGTSLGLYRYDRKKDDFDLSDGPLSHLEINCLAEDHEGTIWAGTYFGAWYFNPVTGQSGHFANEPGNANSLSNNSVNTILEDSAHAIWFGTNGGLCRLDPNGKKIARYTTGNGMPANFVFKILEDDKRNLWVTTTKGLVNLDKNRHIVATYTSSNGLLADQFNYNSGYKDSDGRVYFGSIRGMIAFRPVGVSQSTVAPPLYITGFQVDNKELGIGADSVLTRSLLTTAKVVLPYDQSTFSIDFAAVGFTSPGTTNYTYIMEGLDKQWTTLSRNRKVYFTNLQPGVYTFTLKAASRRFAVQPQKALVIQILPPYWATYWAYGIYVILLASLGYFLFRFYHNRQQMKKEREIYAAKIDFFTHVAHEIRTPLTLIKGPVENLSELVDELPAIKADVKLMERNTDRLIDLVGQLMDFNRIEANGFSLDLTPVNINEIIRDTYTAFEQTARTRVLGYTLELPASGVYVMADAEALNKIIGNLLGNAVKYADKRVEIRMQAPGEQDNSLVIEVSNDGLVIPPAMGEKIFEPFFRLKETIRQKGTGVGLALARSLTTLHKGQLYLKAQDEPLNTFVLRLPLK